MPFWNPKQYDPNMQQFGMNLLQQGMGGPPPTGIGGSISNLGNTLVGALMMRGQNKAQQRGRQSTMEKLRLAEAMKLKTQQELIPSVQPGPSAMGIPNIGVEEVTIPSESQEAFQSRKLQAQIKALMTSEIPEFRMAGEEMMMKTLAAGAPQLEFLKSGDDWLVGNQTTGEISEAYQGQEKFDLTQYDDDKPIYSVGEDGSAVLVRPAVNPPGKDAPKHRKTVINGVTFNEDWNEQTGQWEVSSKAPASGQSITVNTGDPLAPPSEATLGKAWEMYDKSSKNLERVYSIRDDFTDADYTLPDKAKQKYEGIRASVPWLKDVLPPVKDWGEVGATAYRMAELAEFANNMIRDITGAQMTVQEIPRLMKGIVNPDDNPIVARAKLNFTIDLLERTQARYKEALMSAQGRMSDKEAAEYAQREAGNMISSAADTVELMDNRAWAGYGQKNQQVPGTPPTTPTPGPVAAPPPLTGSGRIVD